MATNKAHGAASVLTELTRAWGARRAWLVALSPEEVIARGIQPPEGSHVVVPLGGSPVTCTDVRALGKQARERGEALLVDDTLPGLMGCAAVRLGAHASFATLAANLSLVGVSRDAERVLPGIDDRLERLPQVGEDRFDEMRALLDSAARDWQAKSDAAQVVASYLRCHPSVSQVRYPGLKGDPAFAVASRTLQHGFGPLVDICLKDDATHWQRVTCTAGDPREQVLRLEELLSR